MRELQLWDASEGLSTSFKELAYLARKEDKGLQAAEKMKWKKIHYALKSQHNR
jgi:hypothetical protein